MRFEKEYIKYLIEESKVNDKVKPLLDNYFLNKLSFDGLSKEILDIDEVQNYNSFDKSKRIDDLLE